MDRIPVSGPCITGLEVAYVTDAVTNAWYENAGMYHERFERTFAEYVGTRYAIALPSCTSAIHLALVALGVGPGDEVIVPESTWIASAAPITYVGATPVFADVDERTWCISAESIARCITPRTRAIIPVDLYGGTPDLDAIRAIAAPRDIAIIEDAAEAFGAERHGRRAGSFGDAGTFSFHGSKTLTTGEGGMLVTDREDIYKRALHLRDHGRPPGDRNFRNTEVAFKYRMSAMQAALGLAQTERGEELVERRRAIFGWYREALAGVPGVTLNYEEPGTRNTYWMVTVILDPAYWPGKGEVIAHMRDRGVDCRPFFHPLSSLDAYAGQPSAVGARDRNPVAYALSPRGVNLPSGFNMTPILAARVCDALLAVRSVATPVRAAA